MPAPMYFFFGYMHADMHAALYMLYICKPMILESQESSLLSETGISLKYTYLCNVVDRG